MTKAKRVCPIKGSGGGSAEGAVSYAEEQSLNKIQKDRARGNIGAVSEEELSRKANNDGYYSKMTVGAAESLVGGNYISREFTEDTAGGTADIADGIVQIDRIKGNTIVLNQLVKNGNFVTNTDWITNITTAKVIENNRCTISVVSIGANQLIQYLDLKANHKYFISCFISGSVNNASHFAIYNRITGVSISSQYFSVSNEDVKHSVIMTPTEDATSLLFYMGSNNTLSVGDSMVLHDYICIDLTQMFGAGNEPSTDEEFEKMFPLDYYDYNAGQLLSLNPIGIKTIGFNAYNPATGKASVIGGNQYQITGAYTSIAEGDTAITPDEDGIFTPTKNGDLTIAGGDSTTTCVHLVWSGVRNGEYEEHWEETRNIPIANINTDGTITESSTGKTRLFPDGLCSAGSVHDEITATNAIKRIGKVDLGSLNWTYVDNIFRARVDFGGNRGSMLLNVKYQNMGFVVVSQVVQYDKCYQHYVKEEENDNQIWIVDSSYINEATFKAAMSGVYLYYELGTPVEVTFAEPLNLTYRVSDFGTETLLPINTATPVTTPIRLDVVYGLNVVDFVRNADKNYLTIEDSTGDNGSSFTNLRSALSTAFGIDIVPTYDSTNKRYTFAISDNRKVEVPSSATASGLKGTWAEDTTSVYFCTDTNTWVKINKETW